MNNQAVVIKIKILPFLFRQYFIQTAKQPPTPNTAPPIEAKIGVIKSVNSVKVFNTGIYIYIYIIYAVYRLLFVQNFNYNLYVS